MQFAAPKGTLPHRTVGFAWVALMTIVCISAFFIHELRIWGNWSPTHLLAVFTLIDAADRGECMRAEHQVRVTSGR